MWVDADVEYVGSVGDTVVVLWHSYNDLPDTLPTKSFMFLQLNDIKLSPQLCGSLSLGVILKITSP